MSRQKRKTITFQGKREPVIETVRVKGRTYFALEKLSQRGAFRVFDPHAGPQGDYRVLYRFENSKLTKEKIEVIRRLGGKSANRNFPQVVDYARSKDITIVVVSWIWGTDLRQFLQAIRVENAARPSVYEVVRLFRGLAHGVSHFHRRANLIHGDISPANIILTTGTKQLVLIDFGSAWPVESTAQKRFGDGVTPPYAAPERVDGNAIEDFRSDAFSLAVVAYELLTLEIPFDGLGGRIVSQQAGDSSQRKLIVPSSMLANSTQITSRAAKLLDELFTTSLALHPDMRFGTRNEWLTAWDDLHHELHKRSRLSSWESKLVRGIEFFGNFLTLKRK